MTLVVHTARVNYRGGDRFDITRKTGGAKGEVFAPSWRILGAMLRVRRGVESLMRAGDASAARVEASAWRGYVEKYRDEMLVSYREHRDVWNDVLDTDEITLVCYCSPFVMTNELHCHRVLLAGFLAKLGAKNEGERVAPRGAQRGLAWGMSA